MKQVSCSLVFAGIVCVCFAGRQITPITVEVIDEAGIPVSDAKVRISFSQDRMNKPSITHSGISNTNGLFFVEESGDGGVGVSVYKDGYYEWHNSRYLFYSHARTKEMMPFDPKQEPIEVLLKKIENPIPMYVKKIEEEVPTIEKPVGYDLEKGDWCKPYGSGNHSDFVVSFEKDVREFLEFKGEMTMVFPNKGDGLFAVNFGEEPSGSDLLMPKTAPENGYESKYIRKIGYSLKRRESHGLKNKKGLNYIFRTRSVYDEKGNLIKANYGKLHGDISFEVRDTDTAFLFLHYYYNPNFTRNIEFDPKKNLFTDDRRIYAP